MVYVTDTESWQRIFQLMSERSRWDLSNKEVGAYISRSYNFIMDLFNRLEHSEPFALDPSGDEALRRAKRIRRAALRRGGDAFVVDEADRHFGMPASALTYEKQLPAPVFPSSNDTGED
jgi:hypothetical protein